METLLLVLDLRRDFCLCAERCDGGGQAPARSVRGSGLVVCGGQRRRHYPRPADRCGAAGGDQRLALSGVSLLAGIVTFWRPSIIDRLRSPVLLFDAAGLGLFAVAGTQKALAFGLTPVMAALLGMLTGIGGGMTRDVLLAEIPTVLRADLYAVAALAGAAVVVIGAALRLPSTAVTIAGAVLCFGLRFVAIRRGWHLPVADEPEPPATKLRAPKDRKDDGARRC